MSGPHRSNGLICHDICDGELYQSHPVFRDSPNSLQILAYYDEFTAVNQLSTVAKLYKLG